MKRIISLLLSLTILLTAFCIPANADTTDSQETNYKYLDKFLEKYSYLKYGYFYDELYEYYADDNTSDTPDWALIFGSTDCPAPGTASGVFGEYYIFEHWYYEPYGLGYYIYIPEKDDFFTLEFAWMENVEGIEKAFTECMLKEGYASYVEDYDNDGIITYIDASKMTMGIYNFNSFRERPYIYFDANTTGWENYENIYCEMIKNNGQIATRSTLCTDFDDNGVWKYDLHNLSYIINNYSPLSINFHTENNEFTTQLTFTKDNIGDIAVCFGTDENGTPILKWRKSAKDAITQYEAETGEEVETHRYYFLMPDGTNGEKGDDYSVDDEGNHYGSFDKYAPSWYNEYTDQPAIYWWYTGIADPEFYPGYTVEKGDADCVYYADVPKAVDTIVWNNNIIHSYDYEDPRYQESMQTINIPCEYYDAGESPNYPNGTDNFDNMIFVVDPDVISICDTSFSSGHSPFGGEWYYYYGNGCYGFTENGTMADCLRDDHNHYDYYTEFLEYLDITEDDEHEYSKPLYYHFEDGAETPEWFLVHGYSGYFRPDDIVFGVFGDYFIFNCSSSPSTFDYYVYVTDEQKFYTIEEIWDNDLCSKEEIFTNYLVPKGKAKLIGDADNDDELTVMDATLIQQAEAQYFELEDWIMAGHVYGDEIELLTDFDKDGERSVLDATAIQRKLAQLD